MAYRHEVLTSCSRKLALICGLLLLAVGQAWSAGAPSAPQIKQASVNGVTLVYEEQGDGAPVIFIHGCCTDYRAWDAQRQAIAPHYLYKSAFDLSDMSDAMDDQTAGSMVPRCVADLKPGVCDAPLHGFGA